MKNDAPKPRSVFRSFLSAFVLFLALASLGLYADLATKSRMFVAFGMPGEYLREEQPQLYGTYWLWDDVVGIQTSLNEGALFGMGQGKSHLFAALSLVALAGIVVWLIHSAWKSRLLVVTLALIVAGILGNLYDRLGWHGLTWNPGGFHDHTPGEPVYAVRDWILVMIGSYHWPNFNIADSMLVCGAILLVLHSLFVPEEEPPAKESASEETHLKTASK